MYREYKVKPEMEVVDLQNLLMERYGLDSPDYIVRRAKRLIRGWAEGKHCDSYSRLPKYMEEIKAKNSGSISSCISQNLMVLKFSKSFSFHLKQ